MRKNRKSDHWIQKTHLFRADEFICSFCGYSARKPQSCCPRCGKTLSWVKYVASWVDEAEFYEFFCD